MFGGVTVGTLRRLKRKQRRRMQSAPTITEGPLPSPLTEFRRRQSRISNFSFRSNENEADRSADPLEPQQLMIKYNLRKLKILTKPVEMQAEPIPGLKQETESNGMIYSWIPKESLSKVFKLTLLIG